MTRPVPQRGPDRLPPIAPEDYSPGQASAAAALSATPRGEVRGPFIPLLRHPSLLDRVQALGAQIRYGGNLPDDLRELAILVTARFWEQDYEWHVHAPLAVKAGVSRETISAVADGERPVCPTAAQLAVHDFCLQLHRGHEVDDHCYGDILRLAGEEGIIELTVLCGYYAMLAMVLNTARTPSPGQPFAVPQD